MALVLVPAFMIGDQLQIPVSEHFKCRDVRFRKEAKLPECYFSLADRKSRASRPIDFVNLFYIV